MQLQYRQNMNNAVFSKSVMITDKRYFKNNFLPTSKVSTCSTKISCLSISSPICLNASSASGEGWWGVEGLGGGGVGVLSGGGVGDFALGVDALAFADGLRLLLAFKASSSCGHFT